MILKLRVPAAASFAAGVCTTSAYAEVCDKVMPGWSPADGRVTIGSEVLAVLAAPLPVATVAACILLIAARWHRVALVAGMAASVAGLVHIVASLGDTVVREAAIREGCVTGVPTTGIVWTILGLLFMVVATSPIGRCRKPSRI